MSPNTLTRPTDAEIDAGVMVVSPYVGRTAVSPEVAPETTSSIAGAPAERGPIPEIVAGLAAAKADIDAYFAQLIPTAP